MCFYKVLHTHIFTHMHTDIFYVTNSAYHMNRQNRSPALLFKCIKQPSIMLIESVGQPLLGRLSRALGVTYQLGMESFEGSLLEGPVPLARLTVWHSCWLGPWLPSKTACPWGH